MTRERRTEPTGHQLPMVHSAVYTVNVEKVTQYTRYSERSTVFVN